MSFLIFGFLTEMYESENWNFNSNLYGLFFGAISAAFRLQAALFPYIFLYGVGYFWPLER